MLEGTAISGMSKEVPSARLRIRIVFDHERGMLGPGKAELLGLIEETGSIAAAGRRLGMSYKRAWLLVETMNAMFAEPVVERSRGGASHGGARLTPSGMKVLALYRDVGAKALAAAAQDIDTLEKLMVVARRDISRRK